jgi:hypothetical protein
VQSLQEALSADYRISTIRLREGEYQYALAKTIAVFELDLYFPDVKDIIKRLYGEEKTNDVQFVRKVQTILKKMEKSNLLTILPKKRPWELQKYALTSFKFQDSDKNLVVFATDEQIKHTVVLLSAMINQKEIKTIRPTNFRKILSTAMLVSIIIVSYIFVLWNFTQSIINPFIFIPAFIVAIACSILLGRILAGE